MAATVQPWQKFPNNFVLNRSLQREQYDFYLINVVDFFHIIDPIVDWNFIELSCDP